jgi:hypothetical protein
VSPALRLSTIHRDAYPSTVRYPVFWCRPLCGALDSE